MMGCIRPERNWLFQADSNRRLLASSKSFRTASSRLNALTTLWPEYTSSTWPFTEPSTFCWARKYFWLNLTTNSTSAIETGRIKMAISVIVGLMVSIMMSTPIMVVTLVISWVMLWFRLWPRVSTSLVMRESTSPTVRFSK